MKRSVRGAGERRRFPRYTFEVLSWIYPDADDPSRKIVGRTRNISAKGAFLSAAERVEENTPVRVEIFLMDTRKDPEHSKKIEVIQAAGEVVRNEAEGMAISFREEFETRLSSIEEISGSAL